MLSFPLESGGILVKWEVADPLSFERYCIHIHKAAFPFDSSFIPEPYQDLSFLILLADAFTTTDFPVGKDPISPFLS